MQPDLEVATEAGCDDFIAKPIGTDFVENLKTILARRPDDDKQK